MQISEIKENLDLIISLIGDTVKTAQEVNKNSRIRKDITDESISLIEGIIQFNSRIEDSFKKVKNNLGESAIDIEDTLKGLTGSDQTIKGVASNLSSIRTDLKGIDIEIIKLTRIVEEIKRDTDKIFTLALNASIVSSKYSSKSGVFDILANKLNEMSNFISQNLENIVKVVSPITEGIKSLIEDNETVLSYVTKGNEFYTELPLILSGQKDTIQNLIAKADESARKIENQKRELAEAKEKISTMNSDSIGAINGSDNVRTFAENLLGDMDVLSKTLSYDRSFYSGVEEVRQKAITIWKQATGVNEKSNSQLSFTQSSLQFTNTVIAESESLKDAAEIFYNQSAHNRKVSNDVSERIQMLNEQLKGVSVKISESNMTIQKFNNNYKQIDNILEFLKNILKSMHLIGMYSRIESARDVDVFEGFINISANISSLQKEIQNNIPNIEKNIYETHQLINSVNGKFSKMASDFDLISESSLRIVKELKVVISLANDSENISKNVFSQASDLSGNLDVLKNKINRLPEVAKVPVEGSAANIERGQKVENICSEILECIKLGL